MDEQEGHAPSTPVEVEQGRDDATPTADRQGYWQLHEIVQRSAEEVRRGEAPAYVRRRR